MKWYELVLRRGRVKHHELEADKQQFDHGAVFAVGHKHADEVVAVRSLK
jgi:hypothetical protein